MIQKLYLLVYASGGWPRSFARSIFSCNILQNLLVFLLFSLLSEEKETESDIMNVRYAILWQGKKRTKTSEY